MNNISSKTQCVGCTACSTICKIGAITVKQNPEGFFEAYVDENLCVDCGKCVNVCPMLNNLPKIKPKEFYAGWNNSDEQRINSTSGGFFSGFAHSIIDSNGIVFGAVYSKDNKSVYHTDSDHDSISKMQKSKYVVSDLKRCYSQILKEGEKGRKVLFVGTPCQCAGLHAVLNSENIFLVDFICGGTPSAKAFREYIEYIEKKSKKIIKDIDFRNKDTGWKKQYFRVTYEDGSVKNVYYLYDPYFSLFCIEHLSTRRECSKCKFRNSHFSDLTIADFWGIRNTNIVDDDKGVSLIAINTDKGKALFDMFEDKTVYRLDERDCSYAFEEFPNNNEQNEKKDKFLKELARSDFSDIMNKYVKTDFVSILFKRLQSKLRK